MCIYTCGCSKLGIMCPFMALCELRVVFVQAYEHATLALEATDAKSRAEAYLVRADILKDMEQLVQAEEVCCR